MAPKHKSSDAGSSNILLLCLIYKLNFTTGIYVCERRTNKKKHYMQGSVLCEVSGIPWWSWDIHPVDRADYCIVTSSYYVGALICECVTPKIDCTLLEGGHHNLITTKRTTHLYQKFNVVPSKNAEVWDSS